jgi:hypothetical protein
LNVSIELFEREHLARRLALCGLRVRGSNPGRDFLFSKTIQTDSGVYPASYPVRTCVLSRRQSGRGVKLATHICLARRLRMSGAVRLLSPPPCVFVEWTGKTVLLRDCHVLAYFGSASLVDTLLWFILIIDPKERQTRPISSLLISFIFTYMVCSINPLKAELNPICHLLTLLAAHLIFRVSRIRVKRRT